MTVDVIGRKELADILRAQANQSARDRSWAATDVLREAIARATESTLRAVADTLDPQEG